MCPKVIASVYVPMSTGWKCCCIHHMSSNTWYYLILIFSSIVNMMWYPIVIFIFISLITNGVGYLFICLWANCVFMHSTKAVWIPPMCQALLGSLFLFFEISLPIDCPFFPLGCYPFSKKFYALEWSFVGYMFCKYCLCVYVLPFYSMVFFD